MNSVTRPLILVLPLGLSLLTSASFAAPSETPAQPASTAAAAPDDGDTAKPSRHCLRETGSLIRNAQAQCAAAGRSYSREDIEDTGSSDVGDALSKLDPSLTISHH